MNDTILDRDLKFLIDNKKINSRILSLIEIVTRIILDQFFISYSSFLEDYYNDCGEEFNLNGQIKDKENRSKGNDRDIKNFKEAINHYKDIKDSDNIEAAYTDKNIKYPFDVFGSKVFLKVFLSVDYQIKKTYNNVNFFNIYFKKNILKNLIVDIENINDFLEIIYRISDLRNNLIHKGNIKDNEEFEFYCTKSEQNIFKNFSYIKRKEIEFNLEKSIQALFKFLPDMELSELVQLLIYANYIKNSDNKEFLNNINKIFKYKKEQRSKNNSIISRKLNDAEKNELKKIKEKYRGRLLQKNYSLFEFIRLYNYIGKANILKIQKIIKDFIKSDKYVNTNLSYCKKDKPSIEEIYKIFKLISNINEILRSDFLNLYEDLKNIVEKEKNEKEKEAKANGVSEEEIKKIEESYNKKFKIKTKKAELIRNNIAHSNFFFEPLGKQNNVLYDKLFQEYIYNILKFYNSNYNKKIYNSNYNRKDHNKKMFKESKNNRSFALCKLNFIKQLSSLLLKKDYMVLFIKENDKNKKGDKIVKYEIQNINIETIKDKTVRELGREPLFLYVYWNRSMNSMQPMEGRKLLFL